MRLSILGPLEVTHGGVGTPVPLSGSKQRTLLVALIAARGEVVSADRLIEALWPAGGLADPRNALQVKISQLRRSLGGAEAGLAIRAEPPGYVLDVSESSVDAWQFERLLAEGRAALDAHDPLAASRVLEEAVALWRGPALEEFADTDLIRPLASHLDELRVAATELRAEALMQLGRHAEIIPTLQRSVEEHPLRERLAGLLLVALGRAGRQSEAIDVYQRTRRALDEELGIAPSTDLQRHYERLLRQEDQPPPAPTAEPQAPARRRRAPRLPAAISSFVAREAEVSRVHELVRAGRLITLTGPGGVGKTRLALESVRTLPNELVDAVWWLELASSEAGTDLRSMLVHLLGLHEGGDGAVAEAPTERLLTALAEQPSVLVLDNCEHLLAEVTPLVHELLRGVADLTVLCTSREPLGIPGEIVWSVPSLTAPAPGHALTSDGSRPGALELFVARAREADPGFELEGHLADVGELCRRLDGIPLAIELAAARVAAFSPAQLIERIADGYGPLRSRDRAAPARQRTLQAVVDWSWQLLDDRERTVFRRLAVFRGGWSLEAAEAVCADTPLLRTEFLEVLGSLVDKSLVVHEMNGRGGRYRMLETLRHDAGQRLTAAGEQAQTQDRHVRWVAGLLADQIPRLRGPGQLEAFETLEQEHANVRAALSRLADTDPPSGAELTVTLAWYWYVRDHRSEGRRWLSMLAPAGGAAIRAMGVLWERFLALEQVPTSLLRDDIEDAADTVHGSNLDAPDRVMAQLIAAFTAATAGDARTTDAYLARARALATGAADDWLLALVDFVTARHLLTLGEVVPARQHLERALATFRNSGDRWGQVQCSIALVHVARAQGDAPTGIALAEAGLVLAEELGLGELRAVLWARLAQQQLSIGEKVAAAEAVETARQIAAGLGSRTITAEIDLAAAELAVDDGELDAAATMLEGSLAWMRQLEVHAAAATISSRLGRLEQQRGNLERARELYVAACDEADTAGSPQLLAAARELLRALPATDPIEPVTSRPETAVTT